MKHKRTIVMVALVLFLFVFGRETTAKIGWLVGLPRVTLALSQDPVVKGAALYQVQSFEKADETFQKIGRNTTYNRGLTLAALGQYELAIAYFDAVLFADRWDENAAFNRQYLTQFVPPIIGVANGKGRIDTILNPEETDLFDVDNPLDPVLMLAHRDLDRPVDARIVIADEAWLETLGDAPGEFLANRLAAEHLRRSEAGTLHKPDKMPW